MDNNEFININKNGWDELVKSNKPYSNTSLPEYGPFMDNEDKLKLFRSVKGKSVLELGCSEGKSLDYLRTKGANELWGIDISEEQIKKAKENYKYNNMNFLVGSMEEEQEVPNNYFDYVLSLYSIGFSSDIKKTILLASQYLKQNGKLIISWIHPFFNCLTIEDDKLIVGKSYNDETSNTITKGPDKIKMIQYNLKISTYIDYIINAGLVIDELIEETPIEDNNIGDYVSTYWDKRKTSASPTTSIIVAHKV